MKKERMNISHSRFILFRLKIFGEIVTTYVFDRLFRLAYSEKHLNTSFKFFNILLILYYKFVYHEIKNDITY